jgi:curved DNA-binding protein CbpA
MTDCFALLGQPRNPHLDAEKLKEKFHQLTAAHHPDVSASADIDFSALNRAYSTLRDPVARLRHWLELESPEALARLQPVPSAVAELFPEMSEKHRALEAFLAKQSAAAGPLAQALLAPERLALLGALGKWLSHLNELQSHLLRELESVGGDAKSRVAEIYHHLAYLSKWREQIREGIVKLET